MECYKSYLLVPHTENPQCHCYLYIKLFVLCHKNIHLIFGLNRPALLLPAVACRSLNLKCSDVCVLQPAGGAVSLMENIALISEGTTGLVTWEAALYLAEWALENQQVFTGR